jgi:hypothetical protein
MSHILKIKTKTVTLPDFQDVPIGLIRKSRGETNYNQMFSVVEGLVTTAELKLVDTLTIKEFMAEMKKWSGGASLGEA